MLMKSADVCSQHNCFDCFLHFYHTGLPRACFAAAKAAPLSGQQTRLKHEEAVLSLPPVPGTSVMECALPP